MVLVLLPLAAEATALGLCLGLWLKMNVFMALAAALILSAVCPAVIGVTMHEWQLSRLGTATGVYLHLHLKPTHASAGQRSLDCLDCAQ